MVLWPPLITRPQSNFSALSSGLQRHTRTSPCPVCRGHIELPQGRGVRCAGFTLDRVAFCTREQHAGSLPLDISTSPPAYRHNLYGKCGCGDQHGWNAIASFPSTRQFYAAERRGSTVFADTDRSSTSRHVAPIETRHPVYSAALGLLELRREALADLTRRGLSPEAAYDTGYRSLPRRGSEHRYFLETLVDRFGEQTLRDCPGFTDKNGRLSFWTSRDDRDGYVIPYRDEHGRVTGLQAKILGDRYLTARGSVLSAVYHIAGDGGAGSDLYITEGATKANVASHIGGLWAFAVAGQSLSWRHIEVIKSLQPRRVIVALDREDNRNTERARERWLRMLREAGLDIHSAVWEGQDVGGPKGIDDLIQNGGYPGYAPSTSCPLR